MLNTCLQITSLLEKADEERWLYIFKRILSIIKSDGVDKEVANMILGHYLGMGSFNDLVLYKNGIVDVDGNRELNVLRSKLYEECIAIKTQRL